MNLRHASILEITLAEQISKEANDRMDGYVCVPMNALPTGFLWSETILVASTVL